MSDQFDVFWKDAGKEPQCEPNPNYPEGIDVDVTLGQEPSCVIELPYPASRIGAYVVTCKKCGSCNGCTTAGRPDDPRSIRMPCKEIAN